MGAFYTISLYATGFAEGVAGVHARFVSLFSGAVSSAGLLWSGLYG
jgi:hypothetical protein